MPPQLKAEVQQLSKQNEELTAKLTATTHERDSNEKELQRMRMQRNAESSVADARLRLALRALGKSESAQPLHGGYYFAAAPLKSMLRSESGPPSPSSRESSPTSQYHNRSPTRSMEEGSMPRSASPQASRSQSQHTHLHGSGLPQVTRRQTSPTPAPETGLAMKAGRTGKLSHKMHLNVDLNRSLTAGASRAPPDSLRSKESNRSRRVPKRR